MRDLSAIISIGTSFSISLALNRFICIHAFLGILDKPNERSLHTLPTPRGGGAGIVGGILAGGGILIRLALLPTWIIWLYAGTFLVAVISLVDDFRHLPVRYRLATHFSAASILLFNGFSLRELAFPGVVFPLTVGLGMAFLLLFVVWMTNLYNFMDGMDGLAGGMAVIGFGSMAMAGWLSRHQDFMLANLIISAAVGGFLIYNFPPARIFMGDIGSASLGFLAAGTALWGVQENIFPLWVPVLIFSPFITDATVTLILRALRGEKVWQPHRSHYYQRLALAGWGHRKAVLTEYVIMSAASASALFLWRWEGDTLAAAGLSLWAAIYLLLIAGVNRIEAGIAGEE